MTAREVGKPEHPGREDGFTRTALLFGLGIAGAVLVATAVLVVSEIRAFTLLAHQRSEQIKLIARIDQILSLTKDSETACRGYLLTGKDAYLDPFRLAEPRILELREVVGEAARKGLLVKESWKEVEQLIDDRFRACSSTVDQFHRDPNDRAALLPALDNGKAAMDALRAAVANMIADESTELDALEEKTRDKEVYTLGLIVAGFCVSASIFVAASIVLLLQVSRRAAAEREVAAANERLQDSLGALRERNELINRMGELSHSLQSSDSTTEALQLLSETMPSIFPGTRGALFLTKESRDHLETGATWGEGIQVPAIVGPQECWALRKGKIHRSRPKDKTFRCAHIQGELEGVALCMPLLAHGETRGTIYLEFPGREELPNDIEEFTDATAEQVIMALTNLQLRERLRIQAIRDPLSGLFNRRYMLETAEREIYRASRQNKSPISFVMIDIDHFKRFNDTHGHDAGDHVLQVLAELLRKFVRVSDIPARYGGEEFILVMLDSRKEDTIQRLEAFGAQVRLVSVSHQGRTLGNITLSMGVSNYPEDGETLDTLIKAADMALYEAKRGGRDRVVAAPGQVETA